MFDFGIVVISFFLAVFIFAFVKYHTKTVARGKDIQPPILSGWLPWIGCAAQLGRNSLGFIGRARQIHRRVFTIFAAGQRMTFLTDPKDFEIFFNSPEVSFQLAVQDPCRNTANISKDEFFKYHRLIHDLVKGRLAPSNLHKIASRVCKYLEPVLTKYDTNPTELKMDLNEFVRDVLYSSIVPTLFGDDALPVTPMGFKEFKEKFIKYDGSFEQGAKLPDLFLPAWAECKNYFIQKFDELCRNNISCKQEDTIFQVLIDTIQEKKCSSKYAVLFLWASLANAVPITFWTLAYILCNEDIYKQLMKEMKYAFSDHSDEKTLLCQLSVDDLKKVPLLEYCILEAIRLRSPGMIARKVVKPISVASYTIPAGDLLMLSPYWTHQDESVFPDAKKFKPYRWQNKAAASDRFIAFGGGRYQCPGRWFAMMEMQIFVAVTLFNFNFRTEVKTLPEPSHLHLVGVPQPSLPFDVTITRRRPWDRMY